jgi:hypothetical protein
MTVAQRPAALRAQQLSEVSPEEIFGDSSYSVDLRGIWGGNDI